MVFGYIFLANVCFMELGGVKWTLGLHCLDNNKLIDISDMGDFIDVSEKSIEFFL